MSTVPSFQLADLRNKIVLIRMDHNVVKKGKIKDTMRIDATIPTLLHIYKQGGLPIIMTHVGRPLDKKTGMINITDGEAVNPIVSYLEQKLQLKGLVPNCSAQGTEGITDLSPLAPAIDALKSRQVDFVYLPNTRWFKGRRLRTIQQTSSRNNWLDMLICMSTTLLAPGRLMPPPITSPDICPPTRGS